MSMSQTPAAPKARRRVWTTLTVGILIVVLVGAAYGMVLLFTHTFPAVPVTQSVVQTFCTTLTAHPSSPLISIITPGVTVGTISVPSTAAGTVLFDCGSPLFGASGELPAVNANAGTSNATFILPCTGPVGVAFCSGYTSASIVTPPSTIPTSGQSACTGGTPLVSKALITFGTATGNVPTGFYDYCVSYRITLSATTLPQFNLNWTQ